MEVFILEINSYEEFSKVCHVQPDLDILFVKLAAQIGDRLH